MFPLEKRIKYAGQLPPTGYMDMDHHDYWKEESSLFIRGGLNHQFSRERAPEGVEIGNMPLLLVLQMILIWIWTTMMLEGRVFSLH